MKPTVPVLAPCLAALLLLACGGKSATNSTPDAASTSRVPKEHRASATACLTGRAAARSTADGCVEEDGGLTRCAQDSECTQGDNGRCLGRGCVNACSYDECFQDSDCAGSATCQCRATTADSQPNYCDTTSNCRVDSDCGSGGYCSPSLLTGSCSCASAAFCDGSCGPNCVCGDSCGHGYFCHSSRDTCLEDTDCSDGARCGFDLVEKRFSCQLCQVRP